MTKRQFIYLIPAVLLLLSACAQDDIPALQESRQLSFTVTAGGYASEASAGPAYAPAARAAENSYATTFTDGDACGLYVVRGTNTVHDNVKLTAKKDADTGNLVWQTDGNMTLAGGLSGEQYFLYYPYQTDMMGKTAEITGTTMSDADFFAPLIDGWQPETDQSTYAKYTTSDLMTATGTAATGTGNTLSLSFSMTHRMALAVIDMPKTTYKFTNERMSGNDYTVSSEAAYTSSAKPMLMHDGTYRYLVTPSSTGASTIKGNYSDGSREFTVTPSGIAAGSYKTYKVGGAAETPKNYTVSVGDYLLRDGSLLPKTTTLTEEQKTNVAAIVFWTPAETDPEGRVTPASLTDDKIMAADFPHCTHGLAVAVKAVSTYMVWQSSYSSLYRFQISRADLNPGSSQYRPVASYINPTNPMNYILGYQNTKVLQVYNAYCKANGNTDNIVQPVDVLESFTTSNPAPKGSTGWFIPSPKELHVLCYKDVDNVLANKGKDKKETWYLVNTSIGNAGYEKISTGVYWSSSETQMNFNVNFTAFRLQFFDCMIGEKMKEESSQVRAVCAF